MFLVVAIGMASFNFLQQAKNIAEVSQKEGYYVFTDSKPINEYEYLGTVKTGPVVKSVKHREIMDVLLKNARKKYPEGEAIILSSDYFEADVIKFK